MQCQALQGSQEGLKPDTKQPNLIFIQELSIESIRGLNFTDYMNRLLLCLTLDKHLSCSGTHICYKAVYFCSAFRVSDLVVLLRELHQHEHGW